MIPNISPPSWLNRDAALLISARGLRSFVQSYMAVIIAFYFAELGYGLAQLGPFLSVGVAGVAFFAFLVGLIADKVGRRRLLIIFALVSSASGLALFFVDYLLGLMVIAFIGSVTSGGGGGGESPTQPLVMASLPDTAPHEKRTELFAIYGIVARSGNAIGALAAGLPVFFQDTLGLDTLLSFKVMFVGFAAFQLAVTLLYSLLSPAVEGSTTRQQWVNPLRLPSRRRIFTLTGLFSVDTFTTSMVAQTLIAFWFSERFGLDLGSLPFIFFVSNVLTAISMWVAAKLGNRIGLINTMVFTHIPSSLFFIAAIFAPAAWVAVLFWQFKAFLSQMDIPTKESYTMSVVGPEERVAMASINMVSRSAAGALGPSVTAVLWNALSATVPLMASAIVKIGYDLSLYAMFRNVKPLEEGQRSADLPTAEEQAPQYLAP